ncbi:hypothetical protein KQI63_04545 [bacterium]|nr:hypothetical protein [bacterium]
MNKTRANSLPGRYLLLPLPLLLLVTGCATTGFRVDRKFDERNALAVEIQLDTLHVFSERTEIVVTYDGDQIYEGYLDHVERDEFILLRKHWGVVGDETLRVSWPRITRVERLEYPMGRRSSGGYFLGSLMDLGIGGVLSFFSGAIIGFIFIPVFIL